jgi:NTE family protein
MMGTQTQGEPAKFDPTLKTVVVIAGAGARGAYEAAVLSEVLPKLFPEGLSNVMLLGTSAGAINAALWAARADEKPHDAGAAVQKIWEQIDQKAVFEISSSLVVLARLLLRAVWETAKGSPDIAEALLKKALPWAEKPIGAAFAAEKLVEKPISLLSRLFGGVKPRAPRSELRTALGDSFAFFDTAPLTATAKKFLDLKELERNVEQGKLLGLGIVATSCPMDGSGGRSRVFLRCGPNLTVPARAPNDDSSIDYVVLEEGQLSHEHILASAAIQIAFPPVEIKQPEGYAGWYTDGGVRLNTPIRPALDLGAEQIIVISSLATEYPKSAPASSDKPDILDIGSQAIHSVLGDGTIEDLRNLRHANATVRATGNQQVKADAAQRSVTKNANKQVAVLAISPDNGVLSGYAQTALAQAKREGIEYELLASALASAGAGTGQNELASYLLFYKPFVSLQFETGKKDVAANLQDAFRY